MTVTVIIKALNEEAKIASAIESALAQVEPFGGEVVVADSISTDGTIDVASRYDIRLLQLAEPSDRGCGAGAQLAYQGVSTPYFYLMDGDMTLLPGFLDQALQWLEAHPDCAGVGGSVVESAIANQEFEIRNAAMDRERHRREGVVDRLDGGGLYRTEAIRSVGYFADRNLASYEEFELAARLRAQGWALARLALPAVVHSGHVSNGYRLMAYRWRSGQLGGVGQVVRASLGSWRRARALLRLRQLWAVLTTYVWWLVLLAMVLTHNAALAGALLAAPLLVLAVRRGSLRLGVYSLVSWNGVALASLFGLFRPRVDPGRPIPMVEISSARGRRRPAG